MPANRGASPDWSPKPDFTTHWEIEADSTTPETLAEIANWLSDSSALPEAEVQRFVDDELADEIVWDFAKRMFEDVRSGYFTLEESYLRHQLKQATDSAVQFVTIERPGTSREMLMSSSEGIIKLAG